MLISITDHFANEFKASTCSAMKTLRLLGNVPSATGLQQTSATQHLLRRHVDDIPCYQRRRTSRCGPISMAESGAYEEIMRRAHERFTYEEQIDQ